MAAILKSKKSLSLLFSKIRTRNICTWPTLIKVDSGFGPMLGGPVSIFVPLVKFPSEALDECIQQFAGKRMASRKSNLILLFFLGQEHLTLCNYFFNVIDYILHLFAKVKYIFAIPHFSVGFVFQSDVETHERTGKCVLCGFHKKVFINFTDLMPSLISYFSI